MTLIRAQLKDRIGTVAFDDYAKRNAPSAELIHEGIEAFQQKRPPDFEAVRARAGEAAQASSER